MFDSFTWPLRFLTIWCLLLLGLHSSPSRRSTFRTLGTPSYASFWAFSRVFLSFRTLLSLAIYLANFCSRPYISLCAAFPDAWSLGKSPFHVLPQCPALPASEPWPPQSHCSHHPPSPQDSKLHSEWQSPALGLALSQHLINIWWINELCLIYFVEVIFLFC